MIWFSRPLSLLPQKNHLSTAPPVHANYDRRRYKTLLFQKCAPTTMSRRAAGAAQMRHQRRAPDVGLKWNYFGRKGIFFAFFSTKVAMLLFVTGLSSKVSGKSPECCFADVVQQPGHYRVEGSNDRVPGTFAG